MANNSRSRKRRRSRFAPAARRARLIDRFDAGMAALDVELAEPPVPDTITGKWQPEHTLTLEIAHCPGDRRLFFTRFNGVEKSVLSATQIARLVRKLVTKQRP